MRSKVGIGNAHVSPKNPHSAALRKKQHSFCAIPYNLYSEFCWGVLGAAFLSHVIFFRFRY